MNKIEKLKDYLKQIGEINYLIGILKWEMDTFAPEKSFDYMLDIKSNLELKLYDLTTNSEYINLIDDVLKSDDFNKLSKFEQVYINTLKEDYTKFKKIPKKFYEEYCKLQSSSVSAWAKAKKKSDYSVFKPYLIKIIDATKELYKYMYPNEENLYDSMLNEYEKGVTSKIIDPLFNDLKERLIPIIKKLKKNKFKKINNNYSKSELEDIAKYLLDYIGFDNERGALGCFTHPYTVKLNNNDIRISYSLDDNIIEHIFSMIHEGGHGIFDQNIDKKLMQYDNYDIFKTALHESQSRFYENILGRNKNFWKPIYKDIKKKFNIDLSIDEFINQVNNAYPSPIRIEADELTYVMHVIIRYEIEKEIFSEKIDLNDLPNIWNKKYKEYLGITIKNDREGILQDMHWSDGSFGYFPSYLLGTIFDGMLLENINNNLGDVDKLLKEGKIKEITKYLNKNIHKYGDTYNINEIAKRLCKKELEVEPIIKYFEEKYN